MCASFDFLLMSFARTRRKLTCKHVIIREATSRHVTRKPEVLVRAEVERSEILGKTRVRDLAFRREILRGLDVQAPKEHVDVDGGRDELMSAEHREQEFVERESREDAVFYGH